MRFCRALAISAMFFFAACSQELESRLAQGSDRALSPQVQGAVRVTRQKFVRSLFVSGELAATRSTRIMVPPLLGKGPFTIKALAPEGAFVRPGDLLVQLDNSTLVTSLDSEEINLERAQNDLVRKEAELEAQLKDFEIQLGRAKLALESTRLKTEIPKDLIAAYDWQEYQFAFEKAKKEFEQTTQSLELAKKVAIEEIGQNRLRKAQVSTTISRLRRDISATELRATNPGTVLYEFYPSSDGQGTSTPRKVRLGDKAYWGMNLLSIPDLRELQVRAFVNEVDGGAVRPGLRARIVAEAQPGLEYGGEVTYVPEVAERHGRYFAVRVFTTTIKLDRSDPEIMKPGMTVRVEILLEEQEGLVLPRHAVFQEQGKTLVRLLTGEKQEVKVLARNATHCLIEGLAEGTEVWL
jgi:multidrug efflux pump subunit AcrA (membrane-fusion protein)